MTKQRVFIPGFTDLAPRRSNEEKEYLMSIETGVLVGLDLRPLYWHLPKGRSVAYLPDSRDLWDVIWENRNNTLGFAHSHPGSGVPIPSGTDITTFQAIEKALGRQLVWWICSDTHIVACRQFGKSPRWESTEFDGRLLEWLPELRRHSYPLVESGPSREYLEVEYRDG